MSVRQKKKNEKIRVCINLDKEILEKLDKYIHNLSGFINTTLKNYIENQEKKEIDSHKNLLCQISRNEKKSTAINNELLDTNYQWWTD